MTKGRACCKSQQAGLSARGSRALRDRHYPGARSDAVTRPDIDMTKAIVDIARPLGISVHDPIIVSKHGHASLKGLRLI
jgi:hypothetical protein